MDTTLSDPVVDRLLDGRYAVHHRLPRGGMARVYLATDTRLDRRVAVKLMHPGLAEDPDFVARFNREARSSARLSHPDIVAVYDQGEDDGQAFLVMEYVPGATLRAVLRDRGRLTPAEALAVMDHVLAALGAAHRAGLVHRDVKPENVLVTADGRVKVADFGLARAVAGATVTTDDGTLLGTAAYLAPEQVRDGVADARSDVYSAGVLLFELLTGTPPFAADTALALAYRHVTDEVPAPSTRAEGIPPELDALVLAATAREPEQRPIDARALHASLVSLRDQLGLHGAVPAPPDQTTTDILRVVRQPSSETLVVDRGAGAPPVDAEPAAGGRRRRRGPILLALLLVLALVAGVAGWYLAVGRYTSAPSVLNLSRTVAEAKLTHAGLHAKWLRDVYSDTVAKGLVARETPGPGDRIDRHGTVPLALSAGPETHPVPDVRNDTVAQSMAALKQAHLVFAGTTDRYSATVDKGRVIGTNPPRGSVQHAGTSVTLLVSQGPQPVQGPDVHGQEGGEASSVRGALGLDVTTTEAFNDKLKAGDAIPSNPAAGATAYKGATVSLVVSK